MLLVAQPSIITATALPTFARNIELVGQTSGSSNYTDHPRYLMLHLDSTEGISLAAGRIEETGQPMLPTMPS